VEVAHAQTIDRCSIADHTYIAIGGEQLASIAAYYGLSEGQVAAYNHLTHSRRIYTNQRICVPSNVLEEANGTGEVATFFLPQRLTAPVALVRNMGMADGEKRIQPAAPAFQPVPRPKSQISVAQLLHRNGFGFQARSRSIIGVPAGVSNAYPFGQCTWWAAQRYYQLHNVYIPWALNANAGQWVDRAREFGWHVSSVPTLGSVIVLQGGVEGAGFIGHVGVVEQVVGNSGVIASSMNWGNRPGMVTNSSFSEGPGVTFLSQ
jgi:surface antigen